MYNILYIITSYTGWGYTFGGGNPFSVKNVQHHPGDPPVVRAPSLNKFSVNSAHRFLYRDENKLSLLALVYYYRSREGV